MTTQGNFHSPLDGARHQPAVFKDNNGNRLAVDSGGLIEILSGGELKIDAGGILDFSGATLTSQTGNGTAATGSTATETLHRVHKTTLVVNHAVTMTDHTTAGNQGSLELYDFPSGNISIVGAEGNLVLTTSGSGNITATAALVAALGTAVAGTGDATLTGTEANIVPSTAVPLVAGTVAFNAQGTTPGSFDGKTTPLKAYLNLAVPDAGSTGNDTITAVGTINLSWINNGNS